MSEPDARQGSSVLRKSGWKTYTLGGVLTFLGAAFAFLQGVDWGVIFTRPESVAALGAGVVFGRALVALFRSLRAEQ